MWGAITLGSTMNFRRHYLTRTQAKAWACDNPIGDPYGGPAYGEKADIGSAISAGASILGGIMGSDSQSSAAADASGAQVQAAQLGIAEQRRQFDALRELLKPYSAAGTGALTAQQNLIGLNGTGAQSQAIEALQNSPMFAALAKQGEAGILQNASATGGLRGGNVQGALAQFRPAMLAQAINDQYSRLGGITAIGQNAAAGVGNAGMSSATAISNLLSQQGAAQAGAALAQGKADANMWSGITGAIGQVAGSGGFSNIGNLIGSLF